VAPGVDIRIGEVSSAHGTGQHTTTFAEMHKLNNETYIVDTPGIRGFGLIDIPKAEIAGYFPEMRALLPDCKYYNCLHVNEPGCAVKAALEAGEISETRYRSYLGMYNNDQEDHYR
jgi:ribosome biogenesis GTPase